MLFLLGVTVYLGAVSSPLAMFAALIGLHGLCALWQGTRARLAGFWSAMWPLALAIVLLGSVRWNAPDELFRVGPISVTADAARTALSQMARIVALSLGVSAVIWTTEPGDAVAGLSRLGLPFEIGFPTVMAMQYVITFRRTYQQILEAQQSRGLVRPRGNLFRALRIYYLPVIVPLLIVALRSADSLSLSLQSRGFGGSRKRTSRRVLQMRIADWAFVAGAWVLLAFLGVLFGLVERGAF